MGALFFLVDLLVVDEEYKDPIDDSIVDRIYPNKEFAIFDDVD